MQKRKKKKVVETISEITEEEITSEAETFTPRSRMEQDEVLEEEISAELEEEKEPEPVVAEEPVFKPAFELAFESKIEEEKEEVKEEIKSKSTQITFDDLLCIKLFGSCFCKAGRIRKNRN